MDVRNAGSLQSIIVYRERSVLMEDIEHLLKMLLDDQVQRRTLSQVIISAEVTSLEEKTEGCRSP
jgi:hypothetical protein